MGRPQKSRFEKKVTATFTLDPAVVEQLHKLLPKNQRSDYVNKLLRENLMSSIEHAFNMKRSAAQQMNFWDAEIKHLETEQQIKQERLKTRGW